MKHKDLMLLTGKLIKMGLIIFKEGRYFISNMDLLAFKLAKDNDDQGNGFQRVQRLSTY